MRSLDTTCLPCPYGKAFLTICSRINEVDTLKLDISRAAPPDLRLSSPHPAHYGLFLAYALLMALPILIALGMSGVGGPYSWDDGAITLAFGRTLFETGEFALNASSPRVEGSSSLLLAVLNGALIRGLALDFNEALVGARLISAIFLGATSCLLVHIMRRYLSVSQACLVGLLYCLLPIHYAEVFNGMEMTAFAFFLLLYFALLRGHHLVALVVLPCVLLIRIEAGFYLLVVLGLAVWIAEASERRRFLTHLAALALMLLSLQVFRTVYFDSFLPNTVLAKMHTPYSYPGLHGLEKKMLGGLDFFKLYFVPIFSVPVLFILTGPNRQVLPEHLLIIAFGLFAILSGRNWGYDARMTLSLLAPAIVGVVAAGDAIAGKARETASIVLPLGLALLTLAGHSVGSIGSVAQLFSALTTGAEYARLSHEDMSNHDPTAPYAFGFYGVTPDNYRITGETAEALSDRLDLSVMKFVVPDVGGLGLCCDRLAVIDSALLTNPVLAKQGYEGFDDYLAEVTPDLIQTHGVWSFSTGIYESAFFHDNFTPIVFRNNFMFLRNDHAEALISRGDAAPVPFEAFDFETVRYGIDVLTGLYSPQDRPVLQVR